MRNFGGPRKKKSGGGKSMSIHESIELDRKLGTFRKRVEPKKTLLTRDWNRLKNDGN